MTEPYNHLKETLANLPDSPGVYKMKDTAGKILYIGKAKSLKSRVRSYFHQSAGHSPRIALMVMKVARIDIIVTASEMEALLLEDNLIKEEQPGYNVLLKDDKNYPYLKITLKEKYPRLLLVRKVIKDGSAYFGPYVAVKTVRSTMRLIHKIFPLRQSRDDLDRKPPRRPCLNHQMGRCLAPCAGKVTPDEYMAVVEQVTLFLKGQSDMLIKSLEELMWKASADEMFERAGRYRDQMESVKNLLERQTINRGSLADEDVIASVESEGESIIKIFQVRGGKVRGERHFLFDQLDRLDRSEALGAFIRQFYTGSMEIPPVIVVNDIPERNDLLENRLSAKRGFKVKIVVPVKGDKRKLLDMAERNAQLQLNVITNSADSREGALEEIRGRLHMDEAPKVIEAYDISNSAGVSTVGSVVTFTDGIPDKSGYRKYRIRTVIGPDDYRSMAEVIERRFTKLEREGKDFPDLMIIDGGKGQISAVMKRFGELGIDPPHVVGIAKGKDRENLETDQIISALNGEVVEFPPTSPGRFLLLRVRDEAHRFAIDYHKKLRDKAMTRSSLDAIPGVGPKRKKALLTRFGSVTGVRSATVSEIAETLAVSEDVARKIHDNA